MEPCKAELEKKDQYSVPNPFWSAGGSAAKEETSRKKKVDYAKQDNLGTLPKKPGGEGTKCLFPLIDGAGQR